MNTILIVETDGKLIEKMSSWLPQYNVLVANSAKDAFSLLDRYPDIELIVTQQFIEGEELDTFIAHIHDINKSIYVIVMSAAKPSEILQRQFYAMNADASMYKPFNSRQLVALISYLLTERPKHSLLAFSS